MKEITSNEYERMWRVVDTSLSSHSILRDRYQRRYRLVTLVIMGLSIGATAFAFLATDAVLHVAGLRFSLATLLGLGTILIFLLSLTELVVDWRGRAGAHREAARRLSDLKGQLRAATLSGGVVDQGDVDLRSEYEHTMSGVAAIPEGQFLALKAKHHRKVRLSQLIDSHRGAPLLYLRLLAIVRGLRPEERTNSTVQGSETIEESPVASAEADNDS